MDVHTHEGLRLDTCRNCRGVWFDHVELAAIWNLALDRVARGRTPSASSATVPAMAEDGAVVLTYALAYSPEVVLYGARAAGYAVSASAEALANAPEAAAGLIGGAGEAAASVFETILEIISGLFD
jgi:hypothetical protein